MNMDDYRTFIDIINTTALIKDVNFPKKRADVWFDDLMEFNIDVLGKAFKEVRGARWGFPDIADVRRAALAIQRDKDWRYDDEYMEDRARLARVGEEERKEFAGLLNFNTMGEAEEHGDF